MPITADDVVTFWKNAGPDRWFDGGPDFDAEFRNRFLDAHVAAARRELDAWIETAQGALALMILLDQFPRNAFRGTGHMYATDPLALTFARKAIAAGHDAAVPVDLRMFFYLPFAHSERLEDQDESVRLSEALGAETLKHAIGHRDIIARFGRFPHRNPRLGRETTAEEQAFLDAGGFRG
jgi:uncharacterized protein (DUF924 family)